MNRRGSGILLHITSLPSRYGIGDMGPSAYQFAEFLATSKQRYWQVLPINPTNPAMDNSPYTSYSAFAGNLLLISPDLMLEDGLLTKADITPLTDFPVEKVDYDKTLHYKKNLFGIAYERFRKNEYGSDYDKFCLEHALWLDDFALFMAIKSHFQDRGWNEWPNEVRIRQPETLDNLKLQLQARIELEKFIQYIFFKQWDQLKQHCNSLGVQIIGDVPYYVSYDSADVWTRSDIFKLDKDRTPIFVAGVPPDYFSRTGQLWGNPVYNWDKLKSLGYDWWIQRMKHNFHLFDIVRIDHFRGFVAYWEIPATETTAINGKWIPAPAVDYFNALLNHFPALPIIAEDLGYITSDVTEVIHRFGFPGMRVLQFAFDEHLATNPYAPHNHIQNCVVYTGTHDNNTTKGWYQNELNDETKKRLSQYVGRRLTDKNCHQELIRLALMSTSNTAIIPMQDILGMNAESRMNTPATLGQNWRWRLLRNQMNNALIRKLGEMTVMYGRS